MLKVKVIRCLNNGKLREVLECVLKMLLISCTLPASDLQLGYFGICHYVNSPMQYTVIFSALKVKNFTGKHLIFLIFLLKTLIVGTR